MPARHAAHLTLGRSSEPEHLHFSHLRAIADPEIRRTIIRSKAFHPFAFRLSEDEGICLPKLDSDYTVLHPQVVAYQELTYEEHSKALREVFGQDTELEYGDLLVRLSSAYSAETGHTYRETKLKELLRFLLKKGIIVKEGRGRYRCNSDRHH